MIHDLKPYSAYRQQHLDWLPELPVAWDLNRIAIHLKTIEQGFSPNSAIVQDGQKQWHVLTLSAIQRGRFLATKRKPISQQDLQRLELKTGDVLLTRANTREKVGDVCIVRNPLPRTIFSDLIYRLSLAPKGLLPNFLVYCLRSQLGRYQIGRDARGSSSSMPKLTHAHIRSWIVPVPPPEEQAAIVKFLDHADRRIRRFIKAKQKLIKLLEEQKQVIIHNAVTKGLDPNVKMKPSGVEWLGDVPAHWDVLAFGRLIHRIEQGWSPNAVPGELDEKQWAVTSLSCVKRGAFVPTALKPIANTGQLPYRLRLKDGDFLMTRSNNRERVGDVCIVSDVRRNTIFSDLIYRLTLTDEVLGAFLVQFLLSRAGRDQIELSAQGSSGSMPKLSHQRIKSIRVTLPPFDEQISIAAQMEKECAVIGTTVANASREIQLLQEYRTRLIADVVTGKLDVRQAAANLPDLDPKNEDPTDFDDDNLTDADAEIDADANADEETDS